MRCPLFVFFNNYELVLEIGAVNLITPSWPTIVNGFNIASSCELLNNAEVVIGTIAIATIFLYFYEYALKYQIVIISISYLGISIIEYSIKAKLY